MDSDKNDQQQEIQVTKTDDQYSFPLNLDQAGMKDWIQDVIEFQIIYKDITINYPRFANKDVDCYEWNVTQRFRHDEQPQVKVSLYMHPQACRVDGDPKISQYYWINIITILCAFASLFLESMQILETFKIINKLRNVFEKKDQGEEVKEKDSENRITEIYNDQLQKIKLKNAKTNKSDSNNNRGMAQSFSSQASIYQKIDIHNEYANQDAY